MSKTKKIILSVIIFLFIVLTFLCVFLILKKDDKDVVINEEPESGEIIFSPLKSEYLIDDKIEITNIDIKYNDKVYKSTDSYILFPDEKSYDLKNVTLTQAGSYKIVYFVEADGKKLFAEQTFNVASDIFSFSSESSSAEYKKPDLYDTKGVCVKLAQGDEFKYNKVIDISDFKKDNSIISFYAIPDSFGTADCKDVVIKLTDAYDKNNYVELKVSNASYMGSWADVATYLKGSSRGQTFYGKYYSYLGDSWIRNDWAGFQSYFTLTGKLFHTVHTDVDGNQFKLFMDYENKTFYTEKGLYDDGHIIDLSDKNIFPTPWDGFTTGECFLSVRGENYQSTFLNLVITDICDNDITKKTVSIDNEILIDVNYEQYGIDNIPFAKTSKKYKIFDATATSRYQNDLSVTKKVYFNYGTENQVCIDIVDNCFIPKNEGIYTIVYSSKDYFGNTCECCVDVLSKSNADLSFECIQNSNLCSISDYYDSFNISNIINNSGETKVKGIVYRNNIQYCLLDENMAFVPEYVGNYDIKVICEDYIEKVEKNFSLNVESATISKIIDKPLLPKYFIKNAKYLLDSLPYYNYNTGAPIEYVSDIYVKEDGNNEVKLDSNIYTVNANDNVIVSYKTKDLLDTITTTIPVIDVGYGEKIDIQKYFIPSINAVGFEYVDGYLTIQTSQDASVDFINYLLMSNCEISLKTLHNYCNFQSINLIFTDAITGKFVKITITSDNKNVRLIVNDGKEIRSTNGSFNSISGFDISLQYNAKNNLITIDGENFAPINSFYDGTTFNGFTNNLALFTVELDGVSSESKLSVNQINGHLFLEDNKDFDNVVPQIVVGSVKANRIIGEEFILPGITCLDVLDPYTICSLKIYMGTKIVTINDIRFDGTEDCTKDYKLKFDSLGNYKVEYEFYDGCGNGNSYYYYISVVDNVAPSIVLSNIEEKATVGKSYKIADYELKDNVSSPEKITLIIYVMNENNIFEEIKTTSYTFTQQGKYKIVYFAIDEKGNQAIEKYSVVVSD